MTDEDLNYVLNIFKKYYRNYINSQRTEFPPHMLDIIADPLFKFKDRGTAKKYAIHALSEVVYTNTEAELLYDRLWGRKRPRLPLDVVSKFLTEINKYIENYLKDPSYRPPALRRIGANYNVSSYQKYTKRHLTELFGNKEGIKIYKVMWPKRDLGLFKKKKLHTIIKEEINNFSSNANYIPKSLSYISKKLNISVSTVAYYARDILKEMGYEDIYSKMWISDRLDKKEANKVEEQIIKEIKNFCEDDSYEIPSQGELAKRLGVSRDTIQKRAKKILNKSFPEKGNALYSQIWSSNQLNDSQITVIKNILDKYIRKCLEDQTYIPPSLAEIACYIGISKTSVWRYASDYVPEDLYCKLWGREDPSFRQINNLKTIIRSEIDKWLEIENYTQISLSDIAHECSVSVTTASNYSKEILKNRFGEKWESIYEAMWSLFLSKDKIKEIHDIMQREVDEWLRNNDYFPISLNQIASKLSLSIDSIQKYGLRYLKKKYGKERALELYVSIWLDNEYFWKYVGLKVHNILNCLFTLYFNSRDIGFFSEVKIFPKSRFDGLVLNDLLFPSEFNDCKLIKILNCNEKVKKTLNLDQLDFKKIKALIFDFTFDSSPSNVEKKIDKYSYPSLLFFVISLDKLNRNLLENHRSQVKIIGINQLIDLLGIPQKYKKYIANILNLADRGDLKQLINNNLLSKVNRNGLPELRIFLLKMRLIQRSVKEYLSNYKFKNLSNFS